MDQKQLGARSRECSSASGLSGSATPSPTSPTFANIGFPFSFSRSGATPPPSPSSPSFSFPQTPMGDELSSRKASTLAERYLTFLHLAPGVLKLIGDHGELVKVDDGEHPISEDDDVGSEVPMTRTASDYSYSAGRYSGNGWRIIGDAGGMYYLLVFLLEVSSDISLQGTIQSFSIHRPLLLFWGSPCSYWGSGGGRFHCCFHTRRLLRSGSNGMAQQQGCDLLHKVISHICLAGQVTNGIGVGI